MNTNIIDNSSGEGVSLLRLTAVKERTGLGRSSIYDLMSRGLFPKPIHIRGTRVVTWSSRDLADFVASQLQNSEAGQ